MKIAIFGKGKAGKTILAHFLKKYFFNAGFKIIAVVFQNLIPICR